MGLSGFFSQQATGNRINTAHMQMLKELLHVWVFSFFLLLIYMVIMHMLQFNHIIRNTSDINKFLTQFNGHMLSIYVCYVFSYQSLPILNIIIKQFIRLCEVGFLKWCVLVWLNFIKHSCVDIQEFLIRKRTWKFNFY